MTKAAGFIKPFFTVFLLSSSPFFVLAMFSTYSGIPESYDLLCIGLAAVYSLMTAANTRRSSVILPLSNYSGFIHELKSQLHKMGYQSILCHEFEMKFMHPYQFSYYATDVMVKLSDDRAMIIGPKKIINRLNTRFKMAKCS